MTQELTPELQRHVKRIIGKAAGQNFVRAQEDVGTKVLFQLAKSGFTIVCARIRREVQP